MLLPSGGNPWLGRLGVHPAVMAQAVPFLQTLTWGTFPLFLVRDPDCYILAVVPTSRDLSGFTPPEEPIGEQSF